MHLRVLFVGSAALALLTACEETGGLQQAADSPFAPAAGAGETTEADFVDGLTVGHRLMASGEYELALRAYYRAAAEEGVNVDVLSAIGSANLQLGRLNQAEQILRRAVELDETFPPAWNNLGVVLMEKGEFGEASRVFRIAFALDSGQSAEIRDNLRLALAKLGDPTYSEPESDFRLVRRGPGFFRILETPETP